MLDQSCLGKKHMSLHIMGMKNRVLVTPNPPKPKVAPATVLNVSFSAAVNLRDQQRPWPRPCCACPWNAWDCGRHGHCLQPWLAMGNVWGPEKSWQHDFAGSQVVHRTSFSTISSLFWNSWKKFFRKIEWYSTIWRGLYELFWYYFGG